MKASIKILSVVMFLFFLSFLIGLGVIYYFTIWQFWGSRGIHVVFRYPLFMIAFLHLTTIAGIIASVGMYRLKVWGRRLANIVIASTFILHIFKVLESFYKNKFGHIIVEYDNGCVFYSGNMEWYGYLIPFVAIIVFVFINSNQCKLAFSS